MNRLSLYGEGGFRILKIWLYKLYCNRSSLQPRFYLWVLRAELLWSRGDHDELRSLAAYLAEAHSSSLGFYYLAQVAHIRGEINDALAWLERMTKCNPDHLDGLLLKAACHSERGDWEAAWVILSKIVLARPCIKAWQQLVILIESPADYSRLEMLRKQAVTAGIIHAGSADVLNHIAAGAMRAGNYETAKFIWRDILRARASLPGRKRLRKPKIDIYSRGRAERALLDLNRVLREADIPMYLVSGTLLGCVREGRLLGHDKDIDVGVSSNTPLNELLSAIRQSGLFLIMPSRSAEIVRLRHLNGIPLDIFFHYDEHGTRWHGGVKLRWENSLFDLTPKEFLGDVFNVPTDHDRYLTENYGPDWRIPNTDFDSAFDTPNQRIINLDELRIYAFRQLHAHLISGNNAKVEIYLKRLTGLGEAALAEEIRLIQRDSKRSS